MSISRMAHQFVDDVLEQWQFDHPGTPLSSREWEGDILPSLRAWVKWWIGEDCAEAQQWYLEYLGQVDASRIHGTSEMNMRRLAKRVLEEEAQDIFAQL